MRNNKPAELSGANGSLGADLYNRQLHQLEIDAIRKKAKQLADAGVRHGRRVVVKCSLQSAR